MGAHPETEVGAKVKASGELAGRVAVVTGAAQGMGRAVAERFAAEGAALVLVDVQEAGLAALATGLRAQGAVVMERVCDVADADRVAATVAATMAEYGRLDVLVNAAGIMHPTRFAELTVAQWDRMMAVNLRGTFLMLHAAYPHMLAQGDGRVVNFASTAGLTVSTLGGAHYTASKHGVVGLTRAVAAEGGPHGIRVNAVCPGLIDTEMVCDTIDSATVARFAESFPARRLGTPEEVAELVLFLVSDRSAYISGAALNISGGDLLA